MKVGPRRKISSSEVDKLGIVKFTFCRCVTKYNARIQLVSSGRSRDTKLHRILNKPSLSNGMYMTLMLTCLNVVSLGAVYFTGATSKLFSFTDSVVELA
jgi:hypothetical protein